MAPVKLRMFLVCITIVATFGLLPITYYIDKIEFVSKANLSKVQQMKKKQLHINVSNYKFSTLFGNRGFQKIYWHLPSKFGLCGKGISNGSKGFNWTLIDQEQFAICGHCRNGSTNILVWGDSHLLSSFDAFVLLTHHFSDICAYLFARPGCPPVANAFVFFPEKHFVSDRCLRFQTEILSFLQRTAIKSVLLIARWRLYAEQYLLIPNGVPIPDYWNSKVKKELFEQSLLGSIAFLSNISQLFLFTQIPDFPYFHPDAIKWEPETYLLRRFYKPKFGFQAQESHKFLLGLRKTIRVIDLLPEFCKVKYGNRTFCAPFVAGRTAYWIDGQHVNGNGAMALIPAIGKAFQAITGDYKEIVVDF